MEIWFLKKTLSVSTFPFPQNPFLNTRSPYRNKNGRVSLKQFFRANNAYSERTRFKKQNPSGTIKVCQYKQNLLARVEAFAMLLIQPSSGLNGWTRDGPPVTAGY